MYLSLWLCAYECNGVLSHSGNVSHVLPLRLHRYALMTLFHAFESELAPHRPLAQLLSIKGAYTCLPLSLTAAACSVAGRGCYCCGMCSVM